MSKVIVKGGAPGLIRVELENGEGIDVSSALTAYQALHEIQPWLQAIADSVPVPPPPPEEAPTPVPRRNSKAPPKVDES